MQEIPGDLKFNTSHEWARVEDAGTVTVGISDHAQGAPAQRQVDLGRGVGRAGARVDDVGHHADAEAAQAGDHLGEVGGDVVVVIAEIDHRRGELWQGGEERPVDLAA